MRKLVLCVALLAAGFAVADSSGAAALPPVSAGNEGFSVQGLRRVDEFVAANTDAHGYLGAVVLLARHGHVVEQHAFGHQDLARKIPMARDAIFRIYSMTKTIATVAVLMLVEEGKLALDDPVAKFLPAFAHAQVFEGGSADEPRLRPARQTLTVKQLLTHTAGFATVQGEAATTLLERADLPGAATLAEFAERASRVPLAAEPGARFRYDGTQIEIASRIVEVASGDSFEHFLAARLFVPLGMRDTGFEVAESERHRVVDLSAVGPDARLARADEPSAVQPGQRLHAYASGAGGLYSTAPDYFRFCQMLLDHGRADGKILLAPKTVELMMQNQLMPLDPPVTDSSDAEGFGFGGSVLLDPSRRGRSGAAGQFGWSGAASTYYMIDPDKDLVAILLLQHLPHDGPHELPKLSTRFFNLVHESLDR
ncbi:MAG: serine hydrolase domain-containing protein [Dokdonella sp.]